MRTRELAPDALDSIDRHIINDLQDGVPVAKRPFAAIAAELGLTETEITDRLARLKDIGAVTRFGPFIDAEALGGAFCLCAMSVPPDRFSDVAATVNACVHVAHNYERAHRLNMWFVLACERPEEIRIVAEHLAEQTGLAVLQFPKEREFFIGFRVRA